MCIFLDIFKKEHRTLHELQITIDTVSDLMKDTHEEKAREMGMKRKKKMEKRVSTPKKTKTVKFIKVSPKAYDLLDKYDCTICDKTFVFLKSLKRHLKENHEGVQVPGHLKEKQDLVTCRMCKSKRVSRDQIQRHLKLVHKLTKVEHENKKTSLRGWFTMDDVKWFPLWMDPNDEDPEEEINVPVEGNVIEIFGVQYEVDNNNVPKKNEDIPRKMRKIKLDIDSLSGSTNSQKEKMIADPDTSSVKVLQREESVGYVQDAFFKDDSFEEASPERVPGMSFKRKLSGSPSIEDVLTGLGKDDLTDNTVKVDEDVLEENSEIGSSLTQASNKDLKMKSNTNENLKLKVFVEKEKDVDFWNMGVEAEDLDSDYEEGDSEIFTEARVEMKRLRLV